MGKKRKKKKGKQPNKLSASKYIVQKGPQLEFHESYVNGNWRDTGMASVLMSKTMPSGNYISGLYLLDTFCLGLKKTLFKFNQTTEEYKQFLDQFIASHGAVQKCDLHFAHDMIYGCVDYADEMGFDPHPDFEITEHLLDPDYITDEIDTIEFGKDGMPYYVAGPDDNYEAILNKLEQNLGKDNFRYTIPHE